MSGDVSFLRKARGRGLARVTAEHPTQGSPPTKRDRAPNVNSTNVEKPSIIHRGTEVIKLTIFS